MADEGSDFTEESYYEEEADAEEEGIDVANGPAAAVQAPVQTPPPVQAPAMPPQSRPVHPLFAAGGAKEALAASAARMHQNRSSDGESSAPPAPAPVAPPPVALAPPPSRPVHPLFAAGGVGQGAGDTAATGDSSSSRPVHPLFGGGGGPDGGNAKLALNDQIKAMAAKRKERVATEGVKEPERPKPKKSIDAVMPPGSAGKVGGSMATASMAEQVAMLAAKRRARLEGGGEPEISDKNDVRPASPPAPALPVQPQQFKPAVAPAFAPRNAAPAPTPAAAVTKTESKKSVFGFGGQKKEEASALKTSVKRVPAPPSPVKPVKTKVPAQMQPAETKPPEFTQVKLRAVQDNTVPVGTDEENLQPGMPGTRTTTTTTKKEAAPESTTTTTTVTRVTKGDPEIHVTEYKVGCLCTIV